MAKKKPVRKKLEKEKKLVEKMVKFELEAPYAESVYLVGSFNKWDVNGTPMKKDKSGLWKTNIKLAPGTYEYLFHVDGQWQNDPKGAELKENPFGTRNNVLIVK